MPVDIPADAGPGKQVHIIFTCQQTHIIDLRYAGSEKLDRTRQQVIVVTSPEGIIEGAVHLVQIEIGCGCAGSQAALPIAVGIDFFYKGISILLKE